MFLAVVDSIWAGNTVGYIESKVSRISITDVRLLELKGKAYISDEVRIYTSFLIGHIK